MFRLPSPSTSPRFLVSRRVAAQVFSAAIAGFASSGTIQAAQRRRYAPRFAVKYSMIREGASPEEKLKIAKDSGVDGIEISMRERPYATRLRRTSEKLGLRIHGVICPESDQVTQAIDLCSAVGGDSVLVIAEEKSGITYRENYSTALGLLRRAVGRAERKEVRLLIENVKASFLKEAEEMASFVDALKSPLAGAYFDTGNAITWTKQSAEHWAEVLGYRIKKVDIKDRGHAVFGDAKLRSASAVGTDGGEVHWENVRSSLAKLRFRGWATAEVKGGGQEHLAEVNKWMRDVLREPKS